MANEEYLRLQQSESVVAQMAATIYSGLLHKPEIGRVTEDELVEHAVSVAIKLAKRVEARVRSGEAWTPKESGSSYLAG